MKVIDLRSDTITLPTEEMRQAMYYAELGDDVYGEDPTVNKLERMAAHITGKEAAIFTASGTMSNLMAVMCQTRPGDEIILGTEAHMLWYELGGASALAGVVMREVPNDIDGTMGIETIDATIRGSNIHFPSTKLLCLENTHNRCGGVVLKPKYMEMISLLTRRKGLLIHLDGARIFNAAVYLDIPVNELCKQVDTVCFCLSKGLGAPVGSLLCGTSKLIERARRIRKMLGGGMRQCGVIAAAGIFALKNNITRLTEDHHNARRLAEGLAAIKFIDIEPDAVQTNIVIFKVQTKAPAEVFIKQMNEAGIKLSCLSQSKVRAVTNMTISTPDIDEVLIRINAWVKGYHSKA